jgi:hypothetical protein
MHRNGPRPPKLSLFGQLLSPPPYKQPRPDLKTEHGAERSETDCLRQPAGRGRRPESIRNTSNPPPKLSSFGQLLSHPPCEQPRPDLKTEHRTRNEQTSAETQFVWPTFMLPARQAGKPGLAATRNTERGTQANLPRKLSSFGQNHLHSGPLQNRILSYFPR